MNTHSIEILEARIAPAFAAAFPLAELTGANGFKLAGAANFDFTARSVSAAGDVNGDGFSDILVGAERSNDNGTDSGVAYLVFGKASGFGANVELANLDGINGFKLRGAAQADYAGISVSGAGDVNGDGFADLLVGAYKANDGHVNNGVAYVVFGKAGGFGASVELGELDGNSGFRLTGEAAADYAGFSVSSAGDVNGDGFADVIVGAFGADNGAIRGAAYVVFGKAGGFAASTALSGLNGSNGFKLSGVADGDRAGTSVSGAGDVNGDGFGDVIVGARFANEGGSNRGAAYVFFGKADGFAAETALADLDGTIGFKLRGVADDDNAGAAVSGVGDVNGDGFADVMIGAASADEGGNDRGAAYVVFGKAGGFTASTALSGLNGSNGFKLFGVGDDNLAGTSVSAAGDANGDGFADLFIGASLADEGGDNRGAAYVIFGKASGFAPSVALADLDGSKGFRFVGVADNDYAGTSVSAAGDVNGDGVSDFIVGAIGDGSFVGAAYVVFGHGVKIAASGKTATFTDSDGDRVTATVTKGKLARSDFHFGADGTLIELDLTRPDAGFAGANVTFTAKKAVGGTGDGKVNVGAINASGLDLGTVKVAGDLGQLDAGDGNFKTPGVRALDVQSLGTLTDTQATSIVSPLRSDIVGALARLTVKGAMHGAVNVTGGTGANLGPVRIGGDLDGSAGGDLAGLLRAGGNIGAVTVKGDVIGGADFTGIVAGGKLGKVTVGGSVTSIFRPVTISALGDPTATTPGKAVAIAGLAVKENVFNLRILAGYTASLGATNADAGIGAITVGGNWSRSSVVAGVADSTGDGFGRNDTLIPGGLPAILSTIASVTIKGSASGTLIVGDFFGITAERVAKLKIGATQIPLTTGPNDIVLDAANNDFHVVDIA